MSLLVFAKLILPYLIGGLGKFHRRRIVSQMLSPAALSGSIVPGGSVEDPGPFLLKRDW